MSIVQLNEAQSRLPELVEDLARTGDVVITRAGKPVARLTTPTPEPANGTEAPGARPSLRDLKPTSVGAVLRPLGRDDDLLHEMLAK